MTTKTEGRRRLTDKGVARLRPPETGRLQIPDAVVPGLWLRVSERGVRSWSVMYRVKGSAKLRGGAPQRLTLGRHPIVTCGEARQLARDALALAAKGVDPRERRPPGDTFAAVTEEWLARVVQPKAKAGKLRTAGEIESLVRRRILPVLGRQAIATVRRPDIHRALDPLVDAGQPRAANKAAALIKRIFAYAIDRSHLEADPSAGMKPPGGEERSRDRALTEDELVAIWRACDGLGWPHGPLVRLLILTAQRRSEVAGLSWSELDLERAEWALPAERSKNRRAHVVPLAPAVVAILAALPRWVGTPYVFPTSRGQPLAGFSRAKRQLDTLSGTTGWQLHDLRRTAASGMARLGVAPHVISAVLNHAKTSDNPVTAVYNRYGYEPECAFRRNVIIESGGT
jgi:integrase